MRNRKEKVYLKNRKCGIMKKKEKIKPCEECQCPNPGLGCGNCKAKHHEICADAVGFTCECRK